MYGVAYPFGTLIPLEYQCVVKIGFRQEGKRMKILVLGNGFDLAHGLPTGYRDFLRWAEVITDYTIKKLPEQELKRKYSDAEYREILKYEKKNFEGTEKGAFAEEILNCMRDNLWIGYFLQNEWYQKENWIDFEKEISGVIQAVAEDMEEEGGLYSKVTSLSNSFLKNLFIKDAAEEWLEQMEWEHKTQQKSEISYREIRDLLEQDLKRFIRCLEIYLTDFVSRQPITTASPDICSVQFDKVLSFNYTNTYQRIYASFRKNIVYDFIHGKAEADHTEESNNMVLGMDEYLEGEERNQKTEFIAFKKYYQRIHKETGCKYKDWVEKIRKDNGALKRSERNRHQLYIFGHSLDVTDKDVLRELICNDNVTTTIFYVDKDRYGQQIANLVKVIGQDELIKRVYGRKKSIIFKQQQEMIPIGETDLEVCRDIKELYQLYHLPSEEAIQLVKKVKTKIDSGDIRYFQNQKNVIDVYDISVEHGIVQFEAGKLMEIAKELRNLNPEKKHTRFQERDWANYDSMGEQPCAAETAKFIAKVNWMNNQPRQYITDRKIYAELEQGNLENLLEMLEDYQIKSEKMLEQIIDLVIGKAEAEQGKNANDIILNILHHSEREMAKNFLKGRLKKDTKSYTKLIEHVRWTFISKVLEEEEIRLAEMKEM